ncbi:MAG: PBP1A family penicillin-binding protein [Clostridia bacterium]|nr:PBP1A family penicillin-binding protein [Clostridia bacterium]
MKNTPGRKTVLLIAALAVIIALLFGLVQLGLASVQANMPAWSKSQLETDRNTFIFDNQGGLLAVLHGEKNRVPVPFERMPEHLRQAVIATEDVRFYDHEGVDFKAIVRAVVENLEHTRTVEGASTITQQLAKNSFLTPEKTMERKVKEALLAIQLEKNYSKDEILAMYLNRSYFGHGAYGVQGAAQTYFGKDVQHLTLAESALLAGLLRNPANYSPYLDPKSAQGRMATVLNLMVEAGFITGEEATEARQQGYFLAGLKNREVYRHPFFVDHVIQYAREEIGLSEEQIYRGGLKIYTTMDPKVQQGAEKVFANPRNFPPSPPDQQVQGAVAVLDYRTGQVKALVGGRRHVAKRGYNRATQLKRQPGSTFKPIAVYGPALEQKYPPTTVLTDSPVSFGKYSPKNAGGGYGGPMMMKDALRRSVNVYAVKLFDKVGIRAGFDFARKLGFPLVERDQVLALALGGITTGVSPLEMAAGYGAFANQGVLVEPNPIVKITDYQGNELYIGRNNGQRVMSEQTAYLMTGMLQGVVQGGTGTRARLNRPGAGKTGTTQLPDTREFRGVGGNKDAWFVGYTPELVAAVWLGYDDTDRRHRLDIYGGSFPALIWREVMRAALEGVPVGKFPAYQGKFKFRRDVLTSLPKPQPVPVQPVPGQPGTPSQPGVEPTGPAGQSGPPPSGPLVKPESGETEAAPVLPQQTNPAVQPTAG